MLALWQQVLGVRVVSPDDNFFCWAEIQWSLRNCLRGSNGNCPGRLRFQHSTTRLLPGTCPRADAGNAPAGLGHPGSDQPLRQPLSLFLIHAAEGNVLLYRELASHLGIRPAVYGLQSAAWMANHPLMAGSSMSLSGISKRSGKCSHRDPICSAGTAWVEH